MDNQGKVVNTAKEDNTVKVGKVVKVDNTVREDNMDKVGNMVNNQILLILNVIKAILLH
jgi:hypothetical protein